MKRGRERNLIYWKYYKLHLCITPPNYQPIKAECLLLSHYMEIRSRSESVSRERGRGSERRRQKKEEGERERDRDGGRRREKRQPHSDDKCTMMQRERHGNKESQTRYSVYGSSGTHKNCFWCSVHKSRTTNRLCGCCKFETDKLWWCWQTKSKKGMCPEW